MGLLRACFEYAPKERSTRSISLNFPRPEPSYGWISMMIEAKAKMHVFAYHMMLSLHNFNANVDVDFCVT